MTELNQKILDVLKESDGHMTAEDMYLRCRELGIKVSMASVYRILGKLAADGYVRRISVPGQPDFFDKTLHEHEHLICSICGKITDIRIPELKSSLEELSHEHIESYELCIRYICPSCRAKQNPGEAASEK